MSNMTHPPIPVELLKQPVFEGMVRLWRQEPATVQDDSCVLWDAVQERAGFPCVYPNIGLLSDFCSQKLLHWLVLDVLQTVVEGTTSIACAFQLPELLSYRSVVRYLARPTEYNLRNLRAEGRLIPICDALLYCRENNREATVAMTGRLTLYNPGTPKLERFYLRAQMYDRLEPWLPSVRQMLQYLYPTTMMYLDDVQIAG